MPIQVGTLKNITFSVLSSGDQPLGVQVRLKLAEYADKVPSIKLFITTVSPVTIEIKTYGGSGAVTIHKNSKIIVSKNLGGGVAEIAESALFELLNWSQGDFSSSEQARVTNGDITPKQAGIEVAKCEAKSVHSHGEFMQAIKAKGISLSGYGDKQRTETVGKSLVDVQSATMISAHDTNASATDMMSLNTPEMYWYQTIDGIADATITIRAINAPPQWLQDCITNAWIYNSTGYAPSAELYVKLLNLAKFSGCTLKGGYEFTASMKTVAKEMTVVHMIFKMSMKALLTIGNVPSDLDDKLKQAKLLT